jgi:hypothetical protein
MEKICSQNVVLASENYLRVYADTAANKDWFVSGYNMIAPCG